MPGREYTFQSFAGYRFGFNGKEMDKEGMGGGQSTYDYGFRIYNPALGRFLSVDPLVKDYPWYSSYQFAGNKPIFAIDLDGLEEWVAIYYDGDTKPSLFVFDENLSPLGKNTLYSQTIDCNTGTSTYGTYTANSSQKVNVAFIPNEALVNRDKKHEVIPIMSAYAADAKFFNKLDNKSENFEAIKAWDLADMAMGAAFYAMENDVMIDDAIIDFHGTQHLETRTDQEPHKLDFGTTKLNVDANGNPTNYSTSTSQLFQLIGKFRAPDSETLLGHCNANKCEGLVQNISKDMNSTVYSHKSYSYSSNLRNGKFYGTIAKIFNKIIRDGNVKNIGKYTKTSPDGSKTDTENIGFGTSKGDAGDIQTK